MRVYLDNCCYNRPFDPQNQTRIQIETMAKLAVQFLMATGRVEFVWSDILDYEVSFNPSIKRRTAILRWRPLAFVNVALTDAVLERTEEFKQIGIKAKDAMHLASAEAAECDWLLTTDDGFIPKAQGQTFVRVASPIDFIRENQDEDV